MTTDPYSRPSDPAKRVSAALTDGPDRAPARAMLKGVGLHYLSAAICSFAVAVANNYLWNRHWTFRGMRGHVYYQGLRFLLVSLVALGLNLALLRGLVATGVGKIIAQAVAIVLVTPFSFGANKLWSFRR